MAAAFFEFLGGVLGFQVAGAAADAVAKTAGAGDLAKNLCDTQKHLNDEIDTMNANLKALDKTVINENDIRTMLSTYQSSVIFSNEALMKKKIGFYVKLAINVIVGIMTTVVALFTIVKRSDALSDRISSIEDAVKSLRG